MDTVTTSVAEEASVKAVRSVFVPVTSAVIMAVDLELWRIDS